MSVLSVMPPLVNPLLPTTFSSPSHQGKSDCRFILVPTTKNKSCPIYDIVSIGQLGQGIVGELFWSEMGVGGVGGGSVISGGLPRLVYDDTRRNI